MKVRISKSMLWYKGGEIVTIGSGITEETLTNWINQGLAEKVEDVGKKNEEDLDINKDGKVDKKDVSLAAKILRKSKKIVKAKKKRKW